MPCLCEKCHSLSDCGDAICVNCLVDMSNCEVDNANKTAEINTSGLRPLSGHS